MKLQKTTIILIILALGLGTFIFITETKKKTDENQVENSSENLTIPLFNFTKNDLQNLIIESQNKTFEFEKIDSKIESWQMIKPEKVKANDASLSFLINLLVESKIKENFTITKDKLIDYGLDKPIGKIIITLKNQEKYELLLGKSNFDNSLIYAYKNVNNQDNNIEIILISKSFQYGIQRELNDWK